MVVDTPPFCLFFSTSPRQGLGPLGPVASVAPGGPEKADRGGEEELVEGTHRQNLGGCLTKGEMKTEAKSRVKFFFFKN